MLHFHARLNAHQRANEVRRGAGARRAVVGVFRVGLGPGQEILHVLHAGRHRRADRQAVLHDGGHRHRCEVLAGVVGQLAVDMREQRQHRKRRQRQMGAVGRRGLEHVERNAATCPRAVVHHRSIPGVSAACELFAHAPRDDVARTAGRKAVEDLDLLQRQPGLCESLLADGRQQRGSAGALDELTTVAHGCLLVGAGWWGG